jgi:hypothetical protein
MLDCFNLPQGVTMTSNSVNKAQYKLHIYVVVQRPCISPAFHIPCFPYSLLSRGRNDSEFPCYKLSKSRICFTQGLCHGHFAASSTLCSHSDSDGLRGAQWTHIPVSFYNKAMECARRAGEARSESNFGLLN